MKKLLSVLLCVLLVISSMFTAYAIEYDQDVDMDFGDEFGDDSEEPTSVFVEANENNVRGGYLTKVDGTYTANPYKNATFEGWYDKDGNFRGRKYQVHFGSALRLGYEWYGVRIYAKAGRE